MLRADTLAGDWPALDLNRRADTLRGAFSLTLGPLSDASSRDAGAAERAASGLRQQDSAVWSTDPAVQKKIADRLGWLTSPALMAQSIDRLTSFAASIKQAGFTDVILLGMGGSSLAPEVLRATLGSAPGYPTLHVLDSTDPAAVLAIRSPLATTLFILASKSGSTIEPNSLAAHYIKQLTDAGIGDWAQHFIAITDEGTDLSKRAREQRFREVFINPSDIGGRYSALSFFGMVPAALMGQNVRELVAWGLAMLVASAQEGSTNPSTPLGLLMGTGAQNGRDKMTLFLPPELETFGLWVEQLVAESTGKKGVGVVPVVGEPLDPSIAAASDRVFVSLAVGDNGHAVRLPPSFSAALPSKEAIGAEFVRWEIATAIAGSLLKINPFDEPNVQQAKDATRVLLDRFKADGKLPLPHPDHESPEHVACTLSQAARSQGPVDRFLAQIRPGDYFAVLAYVGPDTELLSALQEFRKAVHSGTGVATTFGYGPRYLHSTGQLHKGGANNGVFIVVSATPERDLAIPGEAFSFGTLELAQALGDFNALEAGGRRALHIHLPAPTAKLFRDACAPLLAGIAPANR